MHLFRYFLIWTIDSRIKFSSNQQQFQKQILNIQQNKTSNNRLMTFRQLTIWSCSRRNKIKNIHFLQTIRFCSYETREIKISDFYHIKWRIIDRTKYIEKIVLIKICATLKMIFQSKKHRNIEKIIFNSNVNQHFNRYWIDFKCINVHTNQFN